MMFYDTELLFWRVYHNKVLRNLIFYQIHSTDWVEYKDYRGVKASSRLKFKDITSFSWMIKKKQFKLLKYKLECNEHIHIDADSFRLFFKEFKGEKQQSKTINTQENKIEILYALLKLFIEKKRDQCIAYDLPKLALKCNNLNLFTILINEPYSMKALPSTCFKIAIQFCSVNVIEKLYLILNKQSTIIINEKNDNQDENSLNIFELLGVASRNRKEPEETMKLLLFGNGTIQFNCNNYSSDKRSITKPINFLNFFLFNSVELKEKIMELELISPYRMVDLNPFGHTICKSNTFKAMLLNIKIYFTYLSKSTISEPLQLFISNSDNDDENQKKENFNNLYKNYILLYKESIDEIKNQHQFGIWANKEAIIFYRYFCETNNNHKFLSESTSKMFKQFKKSIENELIKSWYPFFDTFLDQQQKQAQDYTEEIIILIKDKKFIDWIIDCDLSILYHFLEDNQIHFQTIELFQYAMDSGLIKKLEPNKINTILKNIFFKALRDRDHCVEHLKYIDSLGYQLNNFNIIQEKQLTNIFEDKILLRNLTSYINDNNGLDILKSREIFSLFYKIYLNDKNGLEALNLKSIISAKYEFDVLIFSLFKSSFIDLEYFNFILNIIPFGKVDGPQFNLSSHLIKILKLSSASTSTSMSFKKSILNFSNAKFTFKLPIKEIIINLKLIFKKLVDIRNQDETKSLDGKSIQLITRILFEKFIEIENIGVNDVLEIYNYIKLIDPLFEIGHNIYYSYYFLEIRSKKFINYLMSTKLIEKVFCSNGTDIEEDNDYVNHLLTFFDPKIFTFEMILKKINGYFVYSFDYILEKLIYQLSTLPIKNYNENPILYIELLGLDFISGQIEQDLTFYLETRRIDLFFNKLDYIKTNLSKEINYIDKQQQEQQYKLYYFYYHAGDSSNNIMNDINSLDINQYTNEDYQDFTISNKNKPDEPFHLSDTILSLAIFIMDIKSIEKLIGYYKHIQNDTFHALLLKLSIENNRSDIFQYLDKNYKNELINKLYKIW